MEKPRARSPKVRVLEPLALAKFLGEMRESGFFAAVVLAGLAGLRRGEVIALRWCDIDFTTGVVTVERAAEETNHTIGVKTPKSGRSRFSVLPASAIAALQVVRVEQGLLAERMGPEWNLDDLILPCIATGRLWTPSMFSKSYAAAVAKTTFRKVGLHQLRHSFVSNAVHAGVDPKTLQLIAGHSSAGFTLDRYAHQNSGANALAAAQLDAALIATGFTAHEVAPESKRSVLS